MSEQQTKKYRFCFGIGYVGADHEEIVELPEDMTEDEVEEEFKEWVWNHINGYWEVVEDGGESDE